MRFLFLLLDFTTFFILTAFITTVRSSSFWDVSFFLNNCKVMFPIFLLNVAILFIFSFYDLKKYYKQKENYFLEVVVAFVIAFMFSSTGIYFGASIFHILTPKTNLLLILLMFMFLYQEKFIIV